MKKRTAFVMYLGAMVISFLISLFLSAISKTNHGTLKEICWIINIAQYLVIGILLSRYVLNNLITWHPVNRTIHNVLWTKVKAILFWPFYYPFLLIRLFVVVHL